MEKELSCNVTIHTEELEGKRVYIAECEELDINDFGYTPEEAVENLKKALELLISVEPEKASLLTKEKPLFTTRIQLQKIS